MSLVKRFWYLVAGGIAGLVGALYAVFRRPKVVHIPEMTNDERVSKHDAIDKEKEEKIEAREEKIDKEVDDCLERFRNS